MINILNKIRPSIEVENKLTLWMNHLLVIYTFLIPIHNKSKSSLFFVILLLFLYRMNFWKYLKEAFSNKIVQALLIFYCIHLIGFIYTENIEFGKDTIDKVKYVLFPLLFLSFLDKRFVFRIFMAFVLGVLLSVIVSYGIYFDFLPNTFFIGKYEIYNAYSYDPTPFFRHTDHKVGIVISVSVLLYSIFNLKLSKTIKFIFIFLIVFLSFNMTFLGGRTGYILLVILLFILFILSYQKNLLKTIFLSFFFISLMVFSAYNFSNMVKSETNLTINSLNKVLEKDDFSSSLGLRLGFTKYSLNVIKEHLFIGVGTGDYMDIVRETIPSKHSYVKNISQPHNVYIKLLLQFGIIGLASLFFIFYRIFTYKEYESIHNRNIMIILTIGIMVIMLPGKFFGVFVLPMYMVFTSIMITKDIRKIEYSLVNLKSLVYYSFFTLLFLTIGITK